MSVADMQRLGTGNLTVQQLADMALQSDRDARRAKERGDMAAYTLHDTETAALAQLIRESR